MLVGEIAHKNSHYYYYHCYYYNQTYSCTNIVNSNLLFYAFHINICCFLLCVLLFLCLITFKMIYYLSMCIALRILCYIFVNTMHKGSVNKFFP